MGTLRAVVLCCVFNAAVAGIGLTAIESPARAQDGPEFDAGDWSVTIGAGVNARPEYEGAKSIDVSPIPLLDIRVRPNWAVLDTVYLSTNDGLGALFFNSREFKLGASVGYDFGRDEDDGDRLKGLGEIDAAARLRVFVGTSVGPVDMQLSVQRTIGGVDGTTVSLSAGHTWALTGDLRLRLSAAGDWGDENFMSGYFGVSSEQAARSGLARYDVSSGVKSVSLSTTALYSLNQHWLIVGSLGIKQLLEGRGRQPDRGERTAAFRPARSALSLLMPRSPSMTANRNAGPGSMIQAAVATVTLRRLDGAARAVHIQPSRDRTPGRASLRPQKPQIPRSPKQFIWWKPTETCWHSKTSSHVRVSRTKTITSIVHQRANFSLAGMFGGADSIV